MEIYRRPHMFGGIDSDSCHTNVNQIVEVSGHFGTNFRFGAVKVSQTDQITVAHIVGISIIVYIAFST